MQQTHHFLIAFDSYKDCMSAKKAGECLKKGLKKIFPYSQYTIVPMADGGEGTVESLVDATGGEYVKVKVHDALMRPIDAVYGISADGHTAIMEMAAASGLEKLKPEERNAWITSTFGTGEIIKDAIVKGCKKIIIGIGGSATNDAGCGMAQALGIKFKNAAGKHINVLGGGMLYDVDEIDASEMLPGLKEVDIRVACDVDNPLTGLHGASYVYGPQKGADATMVKKLDDNLKHFAEIIKKSLHKDVGHVPGAGAAGGLGAGLLAFCPARLESGIQIISEQVNLEDKARQSTIVITGEGRMDEQTKFGKTPFGVARVAKKYNKPVIGIAGTLGKNYQELYQHHFDAIMSILPYPMPLQEALEKAPAFMEDTGELVGRMLKI